MIDPDQETRIKFKETDIPDTSDIPKSDEKKQLKRKEDSANWLEEHFGWQPFGVEW